MSSRLSHLPALLAALLPLMATPALAIETQTFSALAFRGNKALDTSSTVDFTLTERDLEGFEKHDREMAETRYFKRFGSNEVMLGYHIEFNRTGLLGSEHRFMEQIRHQFTLDNNNFDTSLRLEERYFDATSIDGSRLRWQSRWNVPLSPGNLLRVGYEWIYNIDYISKSTQRGPSQNRFITSVQHTLTNSDKVEVEFQARLLHVVGAANTMQNQVQLLYNHSF